MTELWLPRHLRPARTPINIVFYKHVTSGRLIVGFPEQYPAPHGFEKIVCQNSHDVEIYSARLRQQEQDEAEKTDYERELIEGPIRDAMRKELIHLRDNARNDINQEFCEFALRKLDERVARGKMIRESYMHVEGYEQGH